MELVYINFGSVFLHTYSIRLFGFYIIYQKKKTI